jgi:hypothetical protein
MIYPLCCVNPFIPLCGTGYEDVNDAERLSVDPVMRAITGKKDKGKQAASTNTIGRFETDILTQGGNLTNLSAVNSRWVQKAMIKTDHRPIILDMDSSESPVHGEQEGSAYNGHFRSYCFHLLFCFNQFGDCEGVLLRPGNVHSADRWKELLALPRRIKHWSLRSLLTRFIKIRAKVVGHSRYVTFQMAEVTLNKKLFTEILYRIAQLRYRTV